MTFIVDTHLPPRLARYLTSKGYPSIHTTHFKDGHLLDDKDIVLIAIEEGRTVITKDSDFFDRFLLKGAPPRVLLIQFGNIDNPDLLRLFDLHFAKCVKAFERGSQLVFFKRDGVMSY